MYSKTTTKCVSILDNGGKTLDRYTLGFEVVSEDDLSFSVEKEIQYYSVG